MSNFITKFPLQIGADSKIKTTRKSKDQFDLFTRVKPYTLVRRPEYGLGAGNLIQNPISDQDSLLTIYLISLREKVFQFFSNIQVTRAVASFDRRNRKIDVSVFVQETTDEEAFEFSITPE